MLRSLPPPPPQTTRLECWQANNRPLAPSFHPPDPPHRKTKPPLSVPSKCERQPVKPPSEVAPSYNYTVSKVDIVGWNLALKGLGPDGNSALLAVLSTELAPQTPPSLNLSTKGFDKLAEALPHVAIKGWFGHTRPTIRPWVTFSVPHPVHMVRWLPPSPLKWSYHGGARTAAPSQAALL